jgi:anti-sigma regulatory factor (Ser/Thr protein kinase)
MSSASLILRNHVSEVGRLVDWVEAFGAEAGLPPDVTFRLTLALDEIVSNVLRHGFVDGADHRISVSVRVEGGMVTAIVEDDGIPFDPHDAPAPKLDAPIGERTPGGLGVHLVKTTMDDVQYRRDGHRNVLTVTIGMQSRDAV